MAVTLQTDPVKSVEGNESRWIAAKADYPINFEFYRKDYSASEITVASNRLKADVSQDIQSQVSVGDRIFLHSVIYGDVSGSVTDVGFSGGITSIFTDIVPDGIGTSDTDASLYINLLSRNYRLRVRFMDGVTGNELAKGDHISRQDGLIRVNAAGWISSFLTTNLDTTFPTVNKAATTQGRPFFIKYQELWDGSNESEVTGEHLYKAVSGAKQLQDLYGDNMLEYTAFNADLQEANKAKFLAEPGNLRYWTGKPFTLGFIFENGGSFPPVYRVEETFDENGVSLGTTSTQLTEQEYNYPQRIAPAGGYAANVAYVDIWIETDIIPDNSCAQLSQADWAYEDFTIDGSNNIVGITVRPATPYSGISSIKSFPNGELRKNGVKIADLIYSIGAGQYQPQGGPYRFAGAIEAFVPLIQVNTTAGEVCGLNFSQSSLGSNDAPIASGLSVSGGNTVGSLLTGTYTYEDIDGDAEDTTGSGTTRKWYRGDTSSPTGLTEVAGPQEDTYTVQAADEKKYIFFGVLPHALTGESPGVEAYSAGLAIPETITIETDYDPATDGDFDPGLNTSDSSVPDWIFEDASVISNNQVSTTGNGLDGTAQDVVIQLINFDLVTSFSIDADQIINTLDLSKLTSCNIFNIANNAITGVTFPNTTVTVISILAANNSIAGAVDLSDLDDMSGVLDLSGNAITGVTFPTTVSGTFTNIFLSDNAITTLSFTPFTNLSGYVSIGDNTSLTSVNFGGSGANVSVIQTNNTAISVLDFAKFTSCTSFLCWDMASLSSVIFPNSTANITNLIFNNCDTVTSLNLAGMTGLGGIMETTGSASLSTITFPVSSRNFSRLWVNSCNISTIDFSNLSGNQSYITVSGNPLTSLTLGTGTLFRLEAIGCQLNYIDFSVPTLSSNVLLRLDSNAMTAAEVNQILVELDGILGSGSGQINISGTNAAPDMSSGGYNGTAAAISLAGKGHTVTTTV